MTESQVMTGSQVNTDSQVRDAAARILRRLADAEQTTARASSSTRDSDAQARFAAILARLGGAELDLASALSGPGNYDMSALAGYEQLAESAVACQSASNNQPASASNIQPRLRLQNPLSRVSTGGSRARREVPSSLTQRRAWEGPVGSPGQRAGG